MFERHRRLRSDHPFQAIGAVVSSAVIAVGIAMSATPVASSLQPSSQSAGVANTSRLPGDGPTYSYYLDLVSNVDEGAIAEQGTTGAGLTFDSFPQSLTPGGW